MITALMVGGGLIVLLGTVVVAAWIKFSLDCGRRGEKLCVCLRKEEER